MVSVLVVGLLLVVVACLVLGIRRQSPREDYRARVELHRIRRRFDVAHFRFELRRDAADARRALRAALDRDKRRRP